MRRDKIKIIEDVVNYLKFYNEHYGYGIFNSEIKSKSTDLFFADDSIESNETMKEKIVSKDEKKKNNELKIKVSSKIPAIKEDWKECDSFGTFADEIKNCVKCSNLAKTRTQVVFGYGNENADVVVVGEAPGADEDIQGKPFVGRAGKLLTDILKAINFSRDEVFICNILKCRPPENRNPLPDEIANCEPYLFKQLEMIKPKLILAVGTFAAQTLLKTKDPLGKMRGKFHDYKGIKMMVTYHPAALLRNPHWKKPTWEDVQLFRKEYDKMAS